MAHLRYVVYYSYEGRTVADPLARRKTEEEVAHALSGVRPDLLLKLDDDTADVHVEKRDAASIIVSINTRRTEQFKLMAVLGVREETEMR